ncbi:lipocalin [Burkholderia cepacia]|nr:lipocalin [Burkholderia cepacia]KWF81496.1 lipocalin [Burkholderia cepacia]NHB10065.1 lipocalin [Burkholderia cepacia]
MKRSVFCTSSVWTTSMALAGAALLLAGCAGLAGGESGNAQVPQPAKAVDLDRYVGRWYEFARYENRFERGCDGVTADYAKREDGLVDVRNTCREGGPGGRARSSDGRAKIVANSGDAKLKVSFFGPFFFGNYWILDHADDYSWSIVGEPSGRFLWILTRVARPSTEQADALVERVRTLGYDTMMLRRTAH